MTSFSQTIYSVSAVNITLERVASASLNTQRAFAYKTVVNLTRLVLKVFDSDVAADGFRVDVSFNISLIEEFGKYMMVVDNNIMPAARRILEIVPKGNSSYNTHSNHVDYLRLNHLQNAKSNLAINITNHVQNTGITLSFRTPYVFGHPLFFTEIINFAYLMFRTYEKFGYFPFPLFSDTYIF